MNERELFFIPTGNTHIKASLKVPPNSRGIVLFVHGSGSGRMSYRNNYVADALREKGYGTMLIDLLAESEVFDQEVGFDFQLLSSRVVDVCMWLKSDPAASDLPLNLYGASTGAAVAIMASRKLGSGFISSIISRGGRIDLAVDDLSTIETPILLIVGSKDEYVLELNRKSSASATCVKRFEVIPGASHLFEEPGTLDMVVDLSLEWLDQFGSVKI